MKILLINPEIPPTFWGFKNALKFISKKALLPPLGLLTVAAMLPRDWETKLVDMATTKLRDSDIRWADYVFITAMQIQRKSAWPTFYQSSRKVCTYRSPGAQRSRIDIAAIHKRSARRFPQENVQHA